MLKGKITRAAGGFFTVSDDQGEEFVCRARGILKRNRQSLIVGDWVHFKPGFKTAAADSDLGLIEAVLPRSNSLERPPVANVDQLVVVMSLKDPECDWQLISRMLVVAEKEDLSTFVCLNKTDLIDQEELERIVSELAGYPYPIIYTSASKCSGLDELKLRLKGSCSVFAGPSGVGKSSLLNAIQPGLSLKTDLLSDKIKRGKHTTRQATLLPLNFGGSVVDTPGFTRLDFSHIEADLLADYFPEFVPLSRHCAFRNCRHINEPDCAVRQEIGKNLSPIRYDHYKYFFEELSREEAF